VTYPTANGIRLLDAAVHLPRVGAWHADITLDAEGGEALGEAVDLDLGALHLKGYVHRAGTWAGRMRARLRGGRLDVTVGPRAYRDVPARVVCTELATAAKLELSSASSPRIMSRHLKHWVRIKDTAGTALQALTSELGAAWRVRPDATLWVGEDTWPPSRLEESYVLDEDAAAGSLVLGVEAPVLEPGTTFLGRRVDRVLHRIRPDRIRTEVWFDRS
jgi:hypothetical protein